MSAEESLNKAYTSGTTQVGSHWATDQATIGQDTQRGQFGTPGSEVHLTDPQRKYLIDRVVNEATLLGMIRKYTMNRSRVEIPRMSVGTRLMRANTGGGHQESTSMGTRVAPDFESIVLTSSKLVLPWTITEEFLEDNPEKGAAEQLIADMMATQAANDLEELAILGDEASGDALLRANNGFIKLGASGNVIDFNGAAFTTNVFERLLRAMPTKYRSNKGALRFFVPFDVEGDYIQTLASRMGDAADAFLAGGSAARPKYNGVPIVPIKYLPSNGNINGGNNESTIFLTDPDNMAWGVEREMKMRKTTEGKNALDFDERYYALHLRCDFLIQNTEAFVMGKEITPRVAG